MGVVEQIRKQAAPGGREALQPEAGRVYGRSLARRGHITVCGRRIYGTFMIEHDGTLLSGEWIVFATAAPPL
jgi:hypothetical protein